MTEEACREYRHGGGRTLEAQAHHLVAKYLEVEQHFQEHQPRPDRREKEERQVFALFQDQWNRKQPRGLSLSQCKGRGVVRDSKEVDGGEPAIPKIKALTVAVFTMPLLGIPKIPVQIAKRISSGYKAAKVFEGFLQDLPGSHHIQGLPGHNHPGQVQAGSWGQGGGGEECQGQGGLHSPGPHRVGKYLEVEHHFQEQQPRPDRREKGEMVQLLLGKEECGAFSKVLM